MLIISTVRYGKTNDPTMKVFINKFSILQGTWRKTIDRRNTCMHIMCQAFRLWLEHQSLSLLSFVMFSY